MAKAACAGAVCATNPAGKDRRIALYDAAAVDAFGGAPVEVGDVGAPLNAAQQALLDVAGELLAAATAAVVAAAKAAAPSLTSHLLVFVPGLLDPAMPESEDHAYTRCRQPLHTRAATCFLLPHSGHSDDLYFHVPANEQARQRRCPRFVRYVFSAS